jgi:hypothetical protein
MKLVMQDATTTKANDNTNQQEKNCSKKKRGECNNKPINYRGAK